MQGETFDFYKLKKKWFQQVILYESTGSYENMDWA